MSALVVGAVLGILGVGAANAAVNRATKAGRKLAAKIDRATADVHGEVRDRIRASMLASAGVQWHDNTGQFFINEDNYVFNNDEDRKRFLGEG